MAGVSSLPSEVKKSNDNGNNGLLLYQTYSSYYCQKVVLALHEKKLKFKSCLVDLYRGEQLKPSFLKLNPKGEVPVLKDGVKIIPDSQRIIDYIEDNFSNGNTPRLIPEKGSHQYQIMERMRDLLDGLPIQLITYGCLLNPQLTGEIRMSPQEVKVRTGIFSVHDKLLTDYSEKYADFRDFYVAKKAGLEKKREMMMNPSKVEAALTDVSYALGEVEKELAKHDGDKEKWWLCSEKFTVADITLSILLSRLSVLGLLDSYFKDGEFPRLQEYFARVQERESFVQTVKSVPGILHSLCRLDSKEQMFVSVAMVLCAAGLAAFLINRHR